MQLVQVLQTHKVIIVDCMVLLVLEMFTQPLSSSILITRDNE